MMNRKRHLRVSLPVLVATLFLACGHGTPARAQQVNLEAPLNNVGHGFYENIGVRWGARGPGWFFNFGGGAPTPFGGNAGGGATFGGAAGGGFFGGSFAQGADTNMISQSPSITIPNGGNGYFIDGSFRPFVTSVMPIVGGPGDPSPLRERVRRMNMEQSPRVASPENGAATEPVVGGGGGSGRSSAERGDLSVAAIKAQAAAKAEAGDNEVAVILEKARGAEAAGKPAVARIYYQMAARRTTGGAQREILARLEALK